jgi:hypothetical protein
MNPKIKKLWTDALRSGDYLQGKQKLNFDGRFCCLGVLCDLAVKDGAIPAGHVHGDGVVSYAGHHNRLPPEVICWAGLEARVREEGSGSWDWEIDGSTVPLDLLAPTPRESLATVNDGGALFSEIADIIEEHL